jgi:hypothetical protein
VLAVVLEEQPRLGDVGLAAAVRGQPGPMQVDALAGERVGDHGDDRRPDVAGRVGQRRVPQHVVFG